jgi:hypothetical protein
MKGAKAQLRLRMGILPYMMPGLVELSRDVSSTLTGVDDREERLLGLWSVSNRMQESRIYLLPLQMYFGLCYGIQDIIESIFDGTGSKSFIIISCS